jgi:hypothetical protein
MVEQKRSYKLAFILHNILYLIIGGAVLLTAFVWWFMASGTFSRLMDSMRPASDKHIRAKLFCEDKQIRDRKLKIETYCISDEKKVASYHLVHELLLTGTEKGTQFLALNERDSFPIDFSGAFLDKEKRKEYPNAQRVYIDTANDTDSREAGNQAQNFMGMTLAIIAGSGALIVVVLGIIVFWHRGG